jgi:hypothetical protein
MTIKEMLKFGLGNHSLECLPSYIKGHTIKNNCFVIKVVHKFTQN